MLFNEMRKRVHVKFELRRNTLEDEGVKISQTIEVHQMPLLWKYE